jgi:glycosyltransferase involved in cell wall biosynthesis
MKVKDRPFLSIITITYNSEKFLEQTIKSVINQGISDIEYIIIDGGSTDGTIDIINKYSNFISYWISEKDNGIYDAINKGIRASNGKYIGIINSDDWYEDGVFAKIEQIFNKSQIDIICGILRLWDDNIIMGVQGNTESFLKYGMISHPTCFVKREVYDSVGLFDINFKIAGDYDFMMRCFNYNCNFFFSETVIANFRMSGISNSDSSSRISEFYKIQYKNKLVSQKKYLFEKLKQRIKKLLK